MLHLLGDFMFAIWDNSRRQLFCARDHLGIKRAVLRSPRKRRRRQQRAGLRPAAPWDLAPSSTSLRLPTSCSSAPTRTTARHASVTSGGCRPHTASGGAGTDALQRYWTLPIEESLQLRRAGEYPERLRALLSDAVRDRLRTRRVVVLMSGGIDSPALAATSLRVLREQPSPFSVQAIASVYDRLIPESERYYAGLVAAHLAIPIHYDVRDDEISIDQWDRLTARTPEPVANPAAFAAAVRFFARASAQARVFLYGEGPDNALRYEWRPYLSLLLAQRRIVPLLRAVGADLWMHRRLPLAASLLKIATRPEPAEQERFPEWLDGDFARRCDCRERWTRRSGPASPHPGKPAAYASFGNVLWQSLFEGCDLYGAASHTDIRHPYLDLRVLQYLLALPVMPWCRDKAVVRQAMARELPNQILRRRKTPVAGNPDFERVEILWTAAPRRGARALEVTSIRIRFLLYPHPHGTAMRASPPGAQLLAAWIRR